MDKIILPTFCQMKLTYNNVRLGIKLFSHFLSNETLYGIENNTQNHPKPPKITQNYQKPPKTTQNCPKLSKTTQNYPKTKINHLIPPKPFIFIRFINY